MRIMHGRFFHACAHVDVSRQERHISIGVDRSSRRPSVRVIDRPELARYMLARPRNRDAFVRACSLKDGWVIGRTGGGGSEV